MSNLAGTKLPAAARIVLGLTVATFVAFVFALIGPRSGADYDPLRDLWLYEAGSGILSWTAADLY